MAALTQLDLSSVRGFTQSVDWVRKQILLKNKPKPRILELEVKLSLRSSPEFGVITVFVDSENGYLFGFRGQDKTYILRDDSQDEYEKLLKQAGNPAPAILRGVGSDHRSLGTFLPNKDSGAGMRGRTYVMANLQEAARLTEFSQSGGSVTESDVAGAISILVCMLAECARSPRIEREFEKIYFGDFAKADESFQVYDKAKRIRDLADVFPNHLLSERVEKLVKRANEMSGLLLRIRSRMGAKPLPDGDLIALCLHGSNSNPGGDKDSAHRVRIICNELKANSNPKTMTEILSLCANEAAVRAAQAGVIG